MKERKGGRCRWEQGGGVRVWEEVFWKGWKESAGEKNGRRGVMIKWIESHTGLKD